MRSLLFLFLLALPASAQPIRVMGPLPPPSDVKPVVSPGRFFAFQPADDSPSYIPSADAYRVYRVKPGSVYIGVKFDAKPDAEPEEYVWPDAKGPVYVLLARNVPGTHTIQLLKNGPPEVGPVVNGMPFQLVISGKGPQPPPKPDPVDPPAPKPDGTSPFPGDGLKVLVVYEQSAPHSPEMNAILYGKKSRDYLDAACGKGNYRIFDKDVPLAGESELWKNVMTRPRKSVPWLLVGNGKTGYEGKLPDTEAEFLDLIKKYEAK
jgi:hypothetical protein